MDIAASLATRVLKERQAIRESTVKAVIQASKEFLDTQEFKESLERAVTLGFLDTPEIRVRVGIQVQLENQDIPEFRVIQDSKEFRVTVGKVDFLASLDSAE